MEPLLIKETPNRTPLAPNKGHFSMQLSFNAFLGTTIFAQKKRLYCRVSVIVQLCISFQGTGRALFPRFHQVSAQQNG